MPDQIPDKRRHLVLQNTSEAKPFTAHKPNGGTKALVPALDRQEHGTALRRQMQALQPLAEAAKARQQEIGLEAWASRFSSCRGSMPTWPSSDWLQKAKAGVSSC